MKLNNLITSRYSVRKYKNEPVEKHKLLKVLDAARMAPSAVNYQPWHFIIVQKAGNLSLIHKTYHREWIKSAPVIIVACADYSQSWKRSIDGKDSAEVDVALAAGHLMLQATELGLGTCLVCNFDAERCAEYLKLPLHITPVALIPVGYPFEDSVPPKRRKTLEEIIHWEDFNNPQEILISENKKNL